MDKFSLILAALVLLVQSVIIGVQRYLLNRRTEDEIEKKITEAKKIFNLKPRHVDVLRAIVLHGMLTKEIAVHLGISENTVKVHRQAIHKAFKINHAHEIHKVLRDIKIS